MQKCLVEILQQWKLHLLVWCAPCLLLKSMLYVQLK